MIMYAVNLDTRTVVDVRVCDSREHTDHVIATRRCHWPSGAVDYCDACAAWMRAVAAAMGMSIHEDPIQVPSDALRRSDRDARQIDLVP